MNKLVGTWRLVSEAAWDAAGQPYPTVLGPMPMGVLSFTAAGRMIAVLADGRPDPIDGTRAYASYCGTYTFDGARLITHPDGASDDRFRSPQIRDVHFEGDRLTMRPPAGFVGAEGVRREYVWERVS